MFEHRIIAFIDILGTKALLADDTRKAILPSLIGWISQWIMEGGTEDKEVSNSNALFLFDLTHRSIIEVISTNTSENRRKIRSHKFDIAAFSDHIVISFPCLPDDKLTLKKISSLEHFISELCVEAFKYGVLLRGAVTQGELYHKGPVVSGKALIDAYEMEEKCAVYPRIILADSIATLIPDANDRFRKSEDGFYSVDWLFWLVLVHQNELVEVRDEEGSLLYESDGITPQFEPTGDIISAVYPEGAAMAKQIIESQIAGAADSGILGKWRWLASYFNQIITEYDVSKEYQDLFLTL